MLSGSYSARRAEAQKLEICCIDWINFALRRSKTPPLTWNVCLQRLLARRSHKYKFLYCNCMFCNLIELSSSRSLFLEFLWFNKVFLLLRWFRSITKTFTIFTIVWIFRKTKKKHRGRKKLLKIVGKSLESSIYIDFFFLLCSYRVKLMCRNNPCLYLGCLSCANFQVL